jgi:hypothetical protein
MVQIVHEKSGARTRGLVSLGQQELLAVVDLPELVPEAEAFLRHIADYVESSGARIRDGETSAYGYWLVEFVAVDGLLEAWEYNATTTEFIRGVNLAVTYWRDQHRTCDRFRAEFRPPRPDRLVMISEGVLGGERDLQGGWCPA